MDKDRETRIAGNSDITIHGGLAERLAHSVSCTGNRQIKCIFAYSFENRGDMCAAQRTFEATVNEGGHR